MSTAVNHPGKLRPADSHDQVMPSPGQEIVNPVAIQHITELLEKRNQIGIERYGTTLQTFNNRDVFRDFADEFTDAWQYYVQIKLENEHRRRAVMAVADLLDDLAVRRTSVTTGTTLADDLKQCAVSLRALWPAPPVAPNAGSPSCSVPSGTPEIT